MEKVALISGASRGIGREIALKLSNEGLKVILFARNYDELKNLENEINSNGGKAFAFAGDIKKEEDIEKLVQAGLENFGNIDILVNNAGIGIFKATDEISKEEWDNIMEVNVRGTFLLTKLVLRKMKENRRGQIISITSDVAKRTFENGSLYCASKYAQDAFLMSLRKEVRKFNIKVSTIYPGNVDSYFNNSEQGEDYKKGWLKTSDIANAVSYILKAPENIVIDELMLHSLSQEY